MSEADYVPLSIWQEQNRKEAQYIRELQDRVSRLERGDEPIDPEKYEKVLRLLERIILAYEQPNTYSELLVDLIQEAKYRTKQARQEERPR